jgi:hypothetical protein
MNKDFIPLLFLLREPLRVKLCIPKIQNKFALRKTFEVSAVVTVLHSLPF